MMKRRLFSTVSWILILLFLVSSCGMPSSPVSTTSSTEQTTEPVSSQVTSDTKDREPYVVSTASLGVVGDILIHETVYKAADRGNGVYDFTETYEFIEPYFSRFDYTVANLEVTLGGPNPSVGSYPSAYPLFNCPDSIVDALKGAGVDLLLTANNHSYDTRKNGLLRTVQVIREKGLEYLGTRDDVTETFYPVKDINGIKVGMACFTYSTKTSDGRKALNGITMAADAGDLVSSFTYNDLDGFYAEAEAAIRQMKQNGAEFTVFYLHWGNEYQDNPNSYQTRIAKKLCELGVDVIVGGHPHVVQAYETIQADNGNETLCIYSTGNFISNQRKELMDSDNYRGYTEDGMIFGVTFEKWSDGRTRVREVNIEPTWVIRERRSTPQGNRWVYQIIPLDLTVSDWKVFSLSDSTVRQARASYDRTMSRVGAGINAAREKLGLSLLPVKISE